jgi:hypothetical protein
LTAANRGAFYMNLTRSGNLADAGKPPRRAPGLSLMSAPTPESIAWPHWLFSAMLPSTPSSPPRRLQLASRDLGGALEGAERLIRSGHIGIIFMELNWAKRAGATCAATESIRLPEQGGYRFSRPGKRLNWQKAGDWLRTLSDVVVHRARP